MLQNPRSEFLSPAAAPAAFSKKKKAGTSQLACSAPAMMING
ncbi:hypothetical protein KNP414_07648 [Paenibacillus mucilaginosus KNP414]|uniref:Uncharacterized protein n=1 Tax=Paenibacillus mucilaginosus (strain KNP414) TaxID=1036673 RepID=F8FCP3_PAEMK|nr:hypothetical protein KNP414_07648 [Paenibacillus mucilaginosus KNP414]